MNREQSIELFNKCEDARKEALDAGKKQGEAHEAAKATWNGWANKLLDEKKQYEDEGTWEDNQEDWEQKASVTFTQCDFQLVKPEEITLGESDDNEKQENVQTIYCEDNFINLSGYIYPSHAYFIGSNFSGGTSFVGSTFSGGAFFEGSTFSDIAYFMGATFSGGAYFEGSTFSGGANFEGSTFSDGASFMGSTFSDTAHFWSSTFSGNVNFVGSTFSGTANFKGSTFSGAAYFSRLTFSGDAHFKGSTFSDTANFMGSTFSGGANFEGSTFSGTAYFSRSTFSDGVNFEGSTFSDTVDFWSSTFSGIARYNNSDFESSIQFAKSTFETDSDFTAFHSKRAFDLSEVRFDKVPNFHQADFTQAPNLANVKVPVISFWRSVIGKLEKEEIPKFRALRRLAIDGHDHERERYFFKGEMRYKRGTVEKWWQIWKPSWWFSLLYDALSDYGTAVLRPLGLWLVMIPLFGWVYTYLAKKPTCTNAFFEGMFLAYQNNLIFFSINRRLEIEKAYKCLYDTDNLPTSLGYIGSFNSLISAFLLFMILLGLRNMFKIK